MHVMLFTGHSCETCKALSLSTSASSRTAEMEGLGDVMLLFGPEPAAEDGNNVA